MENVIKQRQSNIELLRLFAIISVIILHVNLKIWREGDFTFVTTKHIAYILETLSVGAVDIFFLITGYFLSVSNRRNLKKPVALYIQTFVFSLIFLLVPCLLHGHTISPLQIIKCIPHNYFITFYIVLYLISPYINICINALSNASLNKLLIISIALFSLFPTIINYLTPILNLSTDGYDTVSRYGSDSGYNIVNFSLMYIIGAALRRYEMIVRIINIKYLLLSGCLCAVAIFIQLLPPPTFCENIERGIVLQYCSPLVIFLSIIMFCLFSRMSFNSRFVNLLSKASFTCFLIHFQILGFIDVAKYRFSPPLLFLGQVLLTVVGILLISWLVFFIYDKVTKKIIDIIFDRDINY